MDAQSHKTNIPCLVTCKKKNIVRISAAEILSDIINFQITKFLFSEISEVLLSVTARDHVARCHKRTCKKRPSLRHTF